MKKENLLKSIADINQEIKSIKEEIGNQDRVNIALDIRCLARKIFTFLRDIEEEILVKESTICLNATEQDEFEEELEKMSSKYKKLKKDLTSFKGLDGLEDIIESTVDAAKCYINGLQYEEALKEPTLYSIDEKYFIFANTDLITDEANIYNSLDAALENLVARINVLFIKEDNQYVIDSGDEVGSRIYCLQNAVNTAYEVAILSKISSENLKIINSVEPKRLNEIIKFLKIFNNFYSETDMFPYRTITTFLDALIKCIKK